MLGEDSTVVSGSPGLRVQGWRLVYSGVLEMEEHRNDGAWLQRTAQAHSATPHSAGCQGLLSLLRSVAEARHAHLLYIGC